MQWSSKRTLSILLLAALLAFLIARGIVPAVWAIDSDFPNYFTAAKIVADGGDVGRLYDDAWFQDQMREYLSRPEARGKFSPFPPPTALLMVPLTGLSALNALRAMTAVSLLCLMVSIACLSRILSWTLVECSVFVLLSGYAVVNSLRLGQPYIPLSASCIVGYYAYLHRRPLLAGVCFGLLVPLKLFPVIFLVYFLFRKEWRVAFGGLAVIAAVTLASIAILGWKIHWQYLTSILGNHLVGQLSMQDPFSASFESFDSLYRRLFVFDAVSNPQPWLSLPGLRVPALTVTKTAILLVGMAGITKLAVKGVGPSGAAIGILGILTLLLAPATATYHFVLLWLPVGLLVSYCIRENIPLHAYAILGAYSLIGFFPYGHASRFEGRGGFTILAYPRLILLAVMFVAAVSIAWKRAAPVRAPA